MNRLEDLPNLARDEAYYGQDAGYWGGGCIGGGEGCTDRLDDLEAMQEGYYGA